MFTLDCHMRKLQKLQLFDEVTVRRYCKTFGEKGIEGLLECRYSGGKTRLTVSQEAQLQLHLKDNTKRTAKRSS